MNVDIVGRVSRPTLRGSVRVLVMTALLLLPVGTGGAEEQQLLPNVHNVFGPYMELIDELSLRRRVNVLYPNPQSLFDGLQVGFVNVGTGNLTFLRRDIVFRKHGPIVFGRVYDATIDANADLGPRWRLSLAEELNVSKDGTITYIDGFGGAHTFRRDSGGYTPSPPNPWHAHTTIEVKDGDVVLTQSDGTIRLFTRRGKDTGRLVIASLKTSYGLDIHFSYVNGLLAEVTGDGTRLFTLDRRSDGRLARVTDGHGRFVSYSYTAAGQLKDVYDLAGNVWWHEYNERGHIETAIGPNQRAYLRVKYDRTDRAVESNSGRRYSYAYGANQTTVIEGTGERHTFTQDSTGITVKYRSTSHQWEVELDSGNRVQSISRPERTIYYTYQSDGKISTTTSSSATDEQKFHYDVQGRLKSATGSSGTKVDIAYSSNTVHVANADGQFEFTTSPNGVVTRLQDGGTDTDFVYDANGYLVRLQGSDRSVKFRRDGLGRVTATTYPNGQTNTYSYDRLGNRTRVDYAGGGSTTYTHDPAGNITSVEVNEPNGKSKRQTVQVADMNRVDQIVYESSGAVHITYDDHGRPVRFETPDDKVSVEYTTTGAVRSLTSAGTEEVWTPSDDEQLQPPPMNDPRMVALARDRVFAPRRDYGVFAFSDVTFSPILHDPIAQGVQHLEDAQLLAMVAKSVLWDEHADPIEFEKPSNSIFQPDEYRATNCCVPCLYGRSCGNCSIGPSSIGAGGAAPGLCFCLGGTWVSLSLTCRPARDYNDLSNCMFLRQRTSTVNPDGCSYVPENPCLLAGDCTLAQASTSFKPACNEHDTCYRTCGSNRVGCDVRFKIHMEWICDNAYPTVCPFNDDNKCEKYANERTKCHGHGVRYMAGVLTGGRIAYRNNQVRVCACCNVSVSYSSGVD